MLNDKACFKVYKFNSKYTLSHYFSAVMLSVHFLSLQAHLLSFLTPVVDYTLNSILICMQISIINTKKVEVVLYTFMRRGVPFREDTYPGAIGM